MTRRLSAKHPTAAMATEVRPRVRVACRNVGRCGLQRFRQVDNVLGTLCHTARMPTKRPLPSPPSSVTNGASPDLIPRTRRSNSGIV